MDYLFSLIDLGISVAAVIFFAGVLVAGSKVHAVTRLLATPIRDMFGAIFFVMVAKNYYLRTQFFYNKQLLPSFC